ncbi:hypothetical protein RclHR1_21650001 [Rhizophagus clarus]|uniref:Uncharacterized protein n=1 Tax=Rhizophagus clarus TaxID=94130 RepID=A0A2Z6QXW0_9GLOM|nr:hypothetical protein RclHR1_21650001 [Rhizophagus clarus]GES85509.1 hypothetical protein GLOIN_2v1472566 [Rhizophagus clarus]
MNTKNFKSFNKLKYEYLEFKEPLKQRLISQKELTEMIVNYMNNNDWKMLKNCLVTLNDNTIKLSNLMDKQDKVFEAILKFLEKIIMDRMCLDTLSVYRNYIINLIEELEVKLGILIWIRVRNAIHKKRKNNRNDFEKEELKFIKKLEKTLKDIYYDC